jgi:hypothetical protein
MSIFLCNLETEKVALMSPRSPCLSSSVANTIQRQRRQVPDSIPHHLSDDNEISPSSSVQLRDHQPIIRQHFTSIRHHRTEIDTDDVHNQYFSATQIASSRVPIDFRKKFHDVYILPVSPALSSSSSTTNTDEGTKTSSNTMPVRSRRHLSSSANIHNDSTHRGIKNACFTDSPQPKDRTLRRIQPPSQPPPLPPEISQLQFNNNEKSLFQQQSTTVDLDSDTIALRFSTTDEIQVNKTPPPRVPSRSHKPSVLPIGFEELTKQPDKMIDFRLMIESSPQDDYSEHTWPNPPESMSTSEISGRSAIPYDHLIPTVIMCQNSTTNFFHQYRHNEHSMLTESET